jgi:hypothetical protein
MINPYDYIVEATVQNYSRKRLVMIILSPKMAVEVPHWNQQGDWGGVGRNCERD